MAHSGYYTETSNYENVNDVLAEVEAYKNEAETAATNAQLAADSSQTSSILSSEYRNEALVYRNQAEVFKNQAEAATVDKITGPASAVNNEIVRFDGTTGKLAKAGLKYQTSVIDNTSGALSVVGSFGLGGLAIPSTNYGDDCNNLTVTGFYTISNTTTNGPLVGSQGGTVIVNLRTFGSITQIFIGGSRMFTRAFTGSWTSWIEFVKVGDYGLGTAGIASSDLDSITVSGFYKGGSGATGTPVTSLLGHNVYYQGDGSFGTMVAVGYDSGREFVRVRTSGTWGAWAEVLRQGAFGIGGSSVSLSNADTVVETGFYTVTGSTAGTLPASTGVLLHMERGGSNAAFQIFSGLVGTGNPQRVWTRSRRSDSVWTAWSEQWTSTGTNTILVDTGSIGFGTGSGGTVTQATSKATAVTLNKPSGQITMNAAALAASTVVSFTFTNNKIAVGDVIQLSIAGGATSGAYNLSTNSIAAGSCVISLRNLTAGSLSEAVVINFVVLKGATA